MHRNIEKIRIPRTHVLFGSAKVAKKVLEFHCSYISSFIEKINMNIKKNLLYLINSLLELNVLLSLNGFKYLIFVSSQPSFLDQNLILKNKNELDF